MSFASALSRLAGIQKAPTFTHRPTDNNARRALLARAIQGRRQQNDPTPESVKTKSQIAADFSNWMLRTKGIDITMMNEGDAVKLDEYVDLVRKTGSATLDGRRFEEATAWIGERLRREINVSWTDDGLVTDGRLAFDPASALSNRLSSEDAPTIRDALVDSYERFGRQVFDATIA